MALVVKNSPANAGDIRDVGSIPGLGRSPGEGHGNLLQYSCLENPKHKGAWLLQSMGSQRVKHDWRDLATLKHICALITLNHFYHHSKVRSLSCVWLFVTPWTIAYQAPLSMGFSRQEYWSGLPVPSLGGLPDPGIKPGSPALQTDALPSGPPGKQPESNLTYLTAIAF